jgi:hypothetical protein
MPKCSECIHVGVLIPKKGGWFYDRFGKGRRIQQPNIPYCGRLNLAIEASSYTSCNYHEEHKEPTKEGANG